MKHVIGGALLSLLASIVMIGCSDEKTVDPPVVDSSYIKFKANDSFTFNYYERDAQNARIDASKQVKVWTVLSINQTIGDERAGTVRGGVAVIREVTYDGTGTTPMGTPDTFYIHATSEGEVAQYNLLRSVVKRIPGGEIFLDSVPAKWILIGDTKKNGAATWDAIEGGRITNAVAILTIPTTVTLAMNATHEGKVTSTVPKGTYTDAYRTDHKMIITTESSVFNSKDTLNISYELNAKDGILRQSLRSALILSGSQQIPGFEMELVSATHQ